MPIYEYQCQECGRTVEVMQRISDPPLAECSECGGGMKKLLSAPAFQFKGDGWYVTDYARKEKAKGKKDEGSSSEGGSGGGGSSEGAKDSKSESGTSTSSGSSEDG